MIQILLGDCIKKEIFTLFIAIIALASLALTVISGLDPVSKIILAILEMVVSGEVIMRRNKFSKIFLGTYMMSGKTGISAIEKLSKKAPRLWKYIADWGIVVSLGLLSYFVLRNESRREKAAIYIIGLLTLVAVILIVLPASIIPINLINIPQVQSRITPAVAACIPIPSQISSAAPSSSNEYLYYLLVAAVIIGGLAFLIPILLFFNAATILLALASSIESISSHNYAAAYNTLNSQIPGVAPIIPGITIPLAAGIISLIIILSSHEFFHGILARLSRIKIKSTGLLLFGIIPIGAFVEPDEKKIIKLSKKEQNRISIAGVAANMMEALVFMVLMLFFVGYVNPYFSHTNVAVIDTVAGSPACNVITPGSTLLSINGQKIYNISSISNIEKSLGGGNVANVQTNTGNYLLTTEAGGKLGVILTQNITQNNGIVPSILYFIYTVFALSFILSFSLAAFNLLPIAGLDGYRVYQLELGKKSRLLRIALIIVIAALILNVIPLLTSL